MQSFAIFRQFRPLFTATNLRAMDQMQRLEQNANVAEQIIKDIYDKLKDIEKGTVTGHETPELLRLRQENEALKLEVAKWKELLILKEIRNGAAPVLDLDPPQSQGQIKGQSQSQAPRPVTAVETPKKEKAPEQRPKSAPKEAHEKPTEKAPKPKKEVTNTPLPTATINEEVDVGKLDMRIGLITECAKHPDAEALYVEKIDLGEGKLRTIISGLVKHVPLDEMQNRLVVVLANLKPAKMRGIMSEGMVMCASGGEKVEILVPPTGAAPGDLIEVEGYVRAPDAVLNPKKKIWEAVQPHLKTNEKKEATYKGALWSVTGKGKITAPTLANTPIK